MLRTKQQGFTVLEIIVVFTMTSIILISVLQLYRSSILFTIQLRQRTSQANELNFCLDRMVTEITDAISSNAQLEMIKGDGVKTLSGVRLLEYENDTSNEVLRELVWVVSSDEEDSYTIYRKEYSVLDADSVDSYYPICDRISSFDIKLLNAEGLEDPNSPAALMEFEVVSLFDDGSQKTFNASRTFCLRRSEPLGVPDLDEIQSQLDAIAESRNRNSRNSSTNRSSQRNSSNTDNQPENNSRNRTERPGRIDNQIPDMIIMPDQQ